MKTCQSIIRLFLFIVSSLTLGILSCNNPDAVTVDTKKTDSISDEQKHLPENALKGLEIADGLEVKAFATEPMLKNPTNIDVDERGRVWVTEAYNYRPAINGNPTTELGDRIVILEDTNGDGKADTSKIFYQGPEMNAPLGICVLGNKVIVSQSPFVWVFYDDNGDDKADRKEILFSGIGGEQHDHGAHAFTFGPDGKLYFNMGNEGKTLKDRNGKDILDQDGDVIGPKKYKQGLVFRCNPDGSQVECLASNFRNPYEVAVDSYGTLWQSDNDDDGNRGTRINYVMQYGNYGFTDEITGAGWQSNRTNIEDSIPLRHWHLNDPGEVPNLLQTYAGSPTGMIIYEGSLLPAPFQNQMIHCDAGPNIVRSYPIKKNAAGYSATIINILNGAKDQWFRPADVCVAPDGSLMVADWYDPGVGGHAAGDQVRGRIYRVAPTVSTYTVKKQNYDSPKSAIAALQNPNLSVRYQAFTALMQMGEKAKPELEQLWNSSAANARMRARAFWVLVKMSNTTAATYIQQAIKNELPDLRITGIRAALQSKSEVNKVLRALVNDPDPQVRRECALALHHNAAPDAAELWTILAMQYDGKDRWYLEALGIGADQQWDKFFATYLASVKDPLLTETTRDIVWRARTERAVPFIASLAADKKIDLKKRLRYFRALDFNSGPAKANLLLKMIEENGGDEVAFNKVILYTLDLKTVKQSASTQKALTAVLRSVNGTDEFVELVNRYEVKSQNNNLLQLALSKPKEEVGKNAAGLLFNLGGGSLLWNIIQGKDTSSQHNLLMALAGVGSKGSIDMLESIALSTNYSMWLRKIAAQKIGNSWSGEERVLSILKNKRVPAELIPDVVASVSGAWRGAVRSEAASYLPNAGTISSVKKIPTIAELSVVKTNREDGQKVFATFCAVCHQVNNAGYNFGPALSEIGTKLPREGLLESIVHPSAGIGFGYEGWELKMKDGSTISGIIASKTETSIDIKFPGGSGKQVKASDVQSMKQLKQSLMTEGLYQSMSVTELANLIDYLASLEKK
ncbi:MAG: PVC-type heme-binding CxxCH protein [Chitinophagaceae bacterium]